MVDYISQGHVQVASDFRLVGTFRSKNTDDSQTVYIGHRFDKIKQFFRIFHVSLPLN